MEEKTYPNKDVNQLLGQFVPVKLNVDIPKNLKLAERYKVTGIPHVFVMKPDGKVVGSFIGFLEPKEFISTVKPLLTKAKASK